MSFVRRDVNEQHIIYAVCVLCVRCAVDRTLSGGAGVIVFVSSACKGLRKLGCLKLNHWKYNID